MSDQSPVLLIVQPILTRADLPEWFGKRETPGARDRGWLQERELRYIEMPRTSARRWWISDGAAAYAAPEEMIHGVAPPYSKRQAQEGIASMIGTTFDAELGDVRLHARRVGDEWIDLDYLAIGARFGAVRWLRCRAYRAAVGLDVDGIAVAAVMALASPPHMRATTEAWK